MRSDRVTGKDVAALAGVTAATVSNVLNGKSNVSEETRLRVMESVRQLGYAPNQVAKSLRLRNGHSIGVVIEEDLANPRYGRTLSGMLWEASRLGYRLMLCRNELRSDGISDYIAAYNERQVDGVVFVSRGTESPDAGSVLAIANEGIPFVALDCQKSSTSYSTIDFDYREAAFQLTEKVCLSGADRVVYVRPSVDNLQESLREEGVRAACAAADPVRSPVVVVSEIEASGYGEGTTLGEELKCFSKPSAACENTIRDILIRDLRGVIREGDAIICSWAGWSNALSRVFDFHDVIFADLASDYRSVIGADFYCEMPNFEAGAASVDALIDAIEGKEPRAIMLSATCCGAIANGQTKNTSKQV